MGFSGNFNFAFRKSGSYYSIRAGTVPQEITLSVPDSNFNIQKFEKIAVIVYARAKRADGGTTSWQIEYRATDFDASSSGGVTTVTLSKHSTGGGGATSSKYVSYTTRVEFKALFLRCALPNGVYYNFDNVLAGATDFAIDIPLTWTGGNENLEKPAFLDQSSDIRVWSVPEFDKPVYSSKIFANQKMVTLPIIANGSEILRLKAKQGYNGTLTDVISKYNQNCSLNRFVPVILTNGALKSSISSEYDEDEDGHVSVTTTVPDKITLGPLNEHGSSDPYYYSGGNLYYKTTVFYRDLSGYETVSVKYNFTSFDSSTRKIVFSLDTSSYTPTRKLDMMHSPGDVLTVLTGLSFKLSSFYGEQTTSPESDMVILKKGKLYTSTDVTVPTFLILNYTAPASFQSLMAWNGRNGNRSKVY